MTSIFAAGAAGLMMGLRHAFEPDHLAAVGTFLPKSPSPRRAAVVGALWGLGHAFIIFVAGALIIQMRLAMPEWLDGTLEFVVGMMLVFLGIQTARSGFRPTEDAHEHGKPALNWRPFVVGLTHGAAGTGGAVVLVASTTLQKEGQGIAFLGLFGLGAAAGMAALACVLGLSIGSASRLKRILPVVLGAASVVIGVWWMIRAAA